MEGRRRGERDKSGRQTNKRRGREEGEQSEKIDKPINMYEEKRETEKKKKKNEQTVIKKRTCVAVN